MCREMHEDKAVTVVFGHSLAGTAGSNPDGAWMIVFCEGFVLYRLLRRADPASRGVLPTVVCRRV